MKAFIAFLIGTTTLGGVWLLQRSLTSNHPWYWILAILFLIVFGIAAQLVVVQRDEDEKKEEKKPGVDKPGSDFIQK